VCLTPVEADPTPRIPVRMSLNVALRTRTTDVATFTTPFPITVGVAGDGTFSIPHDRLGFAVVDVPLEAAYPGLGRLSVRAESVGDFNGTVDAGTGAVSLAGFMQLLWTKPHPRAGELHMVNCPVGPFALHLSTTTAGGAQLARTSPTDPSARTARLVDDNLAIDAILVGTKPCGGFERLLNQALSLPIVPRVDPTTTTTIPDTTTTPTTPSTIESTTTTEATTTTTVPAGVPETTTTTVGPAAITSPEDTTTVPNESLAPTTEVTAPPDAPADPVASDPAMSTSSRSSGPGVIDGLGVTLDPGVLAFEPIPSMVSTLTIAAVPTDTQGTTPTTQPGFTPRTAPNTVAPHVTQDPPSRHRVVATHRSKHKPNKHAQTTGTTAVTQTATPARNATPPLYFSPLAFGGLRKGAPHNSFLSPVPILGLGADAIAKHRDIASIVFIALLLLPLVAFGFGLVAADFGVQVPLIGRPRRTRGRNRRGGIAHRSTA